MVAHGYGEPSSEAYEQAEKLYDFYVKYLRVKEKTSANLGAWLWLATQNLADYPDAAEKMLNMAEWWLCLTMPPDEVEQIARFKKLNEEQKSVLLSASKLPRCYTEGVVLAKKLKRYSWSCHQACIWHWG